MVGARILWVTNLSAPYRRPVWSCLGDRTELTVGLLSRGEANRRWDGELPEGVRRQRLDSASLSVGGRQLYLLKPSPLRLPVVDAVILPGWEHPAAWQLAHEARRRHAVTLGFYESTAASHAFGSGPVAVARRRFFQSLDAVVSVSEASRRAVLSFGVEPGRVSLVRNSIDTRLFTARDAVGDDPEDRRHHLVYVGQLIARKNVGALIDAVASHPAPLRLTIVGGGPLDGVLRRQVAGLGLKGRVVFAGYLEPAEIPAVLATASTLVLPSVQEVHGLVAVEALCAGLHVVVSSACGVAADIVGMPGVWVARPDEGGVREAIGASTLAWRGPLEGHPVQGWTPEAMATGIMAVVEQALSRQT